MERSCCFVASALERRGEARGVVAVLEDIRGRTLRRAGGKDSWRWVPEGIPGLLRQPGTSSLILCEVSPVVKTLEAGSVACS